MTTGERRKAVEFFFPGAQVQRYAKGWAVVAGTELLSSVVASCLGVDALWLSAYSNVMRRALARFRSERAKDN